MKTVIAAHPFLVGLVALFVNGCVPASQTIGVLNQQSNDAAIRLQDENRKTRGHLQDRRQLEAQLAGMKAKRKSLETSDPVGNRSEIESLKREIANLEHKLKTEVL